MVRLRDLFRFALHRAELPGIVPRMQDYTLAQYKPETFEHLAYSQTVHQLTTNFGYPEELRDFQVHISQDCLSQHAIHLSMYPLLDEDECMSKRCWKRSMY